MEEIIPQAPVTMHDVLEWIGIYREPDRANVIALLGDDITQFVLYSEKEITSKVKYLAEHRNAGNRVSFNLGTERALRNMTHWAKDFYRVGEVPTLDGQTQREFKEAIDSAGLFAQNREIRKASCESRADKASPGKLKDEKGWHTWEQALVTQLGILIGVAGVPLSYVIREAEHKPGTTYLSKMAESVARFPLTGPDYESDALQVHQIIRSLTVGENAEQWLRELIKYKDGRRDMMALRAHYRGEGNNSRRIAAAEQLHSTLHYKDERALSFTSYISKVKEMFNIFQECGEEYTEQAKLRFLWSSIHSPSLQPTIESIKASLGRDPDSWSFVDAANHIASQIPAKKNGRQLSSVSRRDGNKDSAQSGGDGIRLSYPPDEWRRLSPEMQAKVRAARKAPKGQSTGRHGTGKSKGKPNSDLHSLAQAVKKQTKVIASLTSGAKRPGSDDDGSSSSGPDDAGNSFGGRDSKVSAKQKKKNKTT